MSVDEAKRFGCDVPALPVDPAFSFGGDNEGNGTLNKDFVGSFYDLNGLMNLSITNIDQMVAKHIQPCYFAVLDDLVSYYNKNTTYINLNSVQLDSFIDNGIGKCWDKIGTGVTFQDYFYNNVNKQVKENFLYRYYKMVQVTSIEFQTTSKWSWTFKAAKLATDLFGQLNESASSVSIAVDVACTLMTAGIGAFVGCPLLSAATYSAIKSLASYGLGDTFSPAGLTEETLKLFLQNIIISGLVGLAFKVIKIFYNGIKYLFKVFANGEKTLAKVAGEADETCFAIGVCKVASNGCNCFVAGTLVSGLVFADDYKVLNDVDILDLKRNTISENYKNNDDLINNLILTGKVKVEKIPIEEYKEGDYLLTKNVMDGKTKEERISNPKYLKNVFRPIVKTIKQIKNIMAKVTVKNINTEIVEMFTTTKDHEWIVFDNSQDFKNVDNLNFNNRDTLINHVEKRTFELKNNDTIIDINNQKLQIVSVEEFSMPTVTYNFTLADNHNYFVGESGVLVHNACIFIGGINIGKTSNYATKFNDIVIKPVRFFAIDANHRLPPGILKDSQKGLVELLERLGLKDINDPLLMEWMEASINRGSHIKAWNKEVGGRINLSADEILAIWKKIESDPIIKFIERPPGAINIF